jgi:hypothetical protein
MRRPLLRSSIGLLPCSRTLPPVPVKVSVSVSAMGWSRSQRRPENRCKQMKHPFDRRRDAQGFGEEEWREVK